MRLLVRIVLLATTLLPVLGAAPSARAQVDSREGIALQNQIYQLRQDLKIMQDQLARGGGGRGSSSPALSSSGANDLVAQLLVRMDQLEDQVRQLRGRLDETQFQLQRQNADLTKRIDDLAFQINPQAGAAATPPPSGGVLAPPGAPTPPAGPRPPPGPRTPEVALQDGNAALARRDYSAAEAAAREVLTNRTSPRAYDAQLLLAQALSGEKQYPQAAIAFDDAYNRSRKGTHAPDALVGLAASLTAINEKKAACDTLAKLRTEFPQTRPDIHDSAAATAQRAGCR